MTAKRVPNRELFAGLGMAILVLVGAEEAGAQVRGVYPLGMSASNSGVTPAPGFTYSNQFLFYSRNESKGAEGEVVATGRNAVMMDMNSFVWVSRREIWGACYSVSATLPIATNSLSSDAAGAISGGGGFADSYYQPLIMGWHFSRVDLRIAYGFLAPTGRFEAGANDNVGAGYWTHTLSSGQTVHLLKGKSLAISAFELYEFHGAQEGTGIEPGQTMNLDCSLLQTLSPGTSLRVQVGLVGYGQWQTTGKGGPGVTPEEAEARYRILALGVGSNLMLPDRKVTLGLRYFDEFEGRSTFQGGALQITGSISF